MKKIIEGDVKLTELCLFKLPDFLSDVVIRGSFWCGYNELTSLKGCPQSVGGGFYCDNNPKKFTEEEIRRVCNVKGNVYV